MTLSSGWWRNTSVRLRYSILQYHARMPLSLLHYLSQIVNVIFRQRWSNLGGRLQPVEPTTCVQLSGKWTLWVPEEVHITLQSRVCSFNGLMDQTSLTLRSGFSHMIRMRQSHSMSSRGGCLHHLILLQWQMKKSRQQHASARRTLPFATVDILATLSSLKNSLHSSVAS